VTLEVRRSSAEETAPLRRLVLRAGDPAPLDGDDDATAVHVAAVRGGVVVGCGNVRPEPAPVPLSTPAWRLRGMATAADLRSTGVGARVLAALEALVREAGGRALWANARTPAQPFYERAGWTVVGEPWDDPRIGPHVRMVRHLD
jgi:predicted GNAT family N-acyltransferase